MEGDQHRDFSINIGDFKGENTENTENFLEFSGGF